MRLFYRRPLSIVLCIMLGGFVIFTVGDTQIKKLTETVAVFLFIAFIVTLILKQKRPILLISSVALIAVTVFSDLYFGMFYVAERFEDTVEITGTVIDRDFPNSYTTQYVVKTDNINGDKNSSHKLLMYLQDKDVDTLNIGSVISFKCDIKDISDKEYASYRYAKGISAVCENISEFVVHSEERFVLNEFFAYIRENLTRYVILLSGRETGEMVSALLFGQRSALSPRVNLNFKRLGITHILALSGMHLALLSTAVDRILKYLQVHKKIRTLSVVLLSVFYMAFTGFSTSILRAGIMLILSSILFLFSREQDSVTSLLLSVTIIILFTPYAIFDISLWLSAFATLGVIMYSEWKESEKKRKKETLIKRILSIITESLGISVFAITATLFITHFSFEGISILSPIATLIFTVLTTVIMYLGALMVIIGKIFPIDIILNPIVKLTNEIADIMASLDVYVSKDHPIIDLIVILLTAVFFAFLILNIKRKRLFVLTILVLFSSLYISAGILSKINDQDDVICYSTAYRSNDFIIRSNGETCLVSSSTYSKSTGYNSIDTLEEFGITHLDKYYVTHLSRNLETDLDIILSNVLTDEIYLPYPKNEDEISIVKSLYSFIKKYSSKICLYDNNEIIKAGDFEIISIHSTAYGDDTAQNAFFINGKEEKILYLSSGILAGSKKDTAYKSMRDATALILGNHGKKYKSEIYLEAEYNFLEQIIIDGENIYLTENASDVYNKKGCKIYSHPKSVILFD